MREVRPIVQPRAAEGLLCEFKTQGLDQMQMRIQADTQATNVAGVGRDLRLVEDDVEHGQDQQFVSLRQQQHAVSQLLGQIHGHITSVHQPTVRRLRRS